ncbi:hypothetical protein ILUMI_06952 [Ignelater luminosus]|uniref:Uncharacterized protein n=1 Tax=Ignelater luminosus TaxID=2038154 RepID=A0A8K0D9N7_IGNLU|nr:hypothetical protein ILUMI_06952 [Ignelater luminosus]
MKWFYLVGLLLLGVLSCKADENDLQDITKDSDSDEEFYTELKDLFEKKCKSVGGDNAIKNLTTVVEGLKICITDQLPADASKFKELADSGSSEDLCTDKRKVIRDCFNDLVHVWEDCSVPEEQYVAGFFLDSVDSLLDYICADDGAIILSLINDDTIDCVFSLAEQENATDVCTNEFKVLNDDTPDDIIITKSELCHDLKTAQECYGKYLEEQCPKATALSEAFVGALKAISSPCNKRRRRYLFNL